MPWRQDFKSVGFSVIRREERSLGLVLFVWPFGIKKRRRGTQAKKNKKAVLREFRKEKERVWHLFFFLLLSAGVGSRGLVRDLKKRGERIEGVGFRVEVKGRVKPTISVWERKIEPSHPFFFGKARCEFGLVFGRARLVAWQSEWVFLVSVP